MESKVRKIRMEEILVKEFLPTDIQVLDVSLEHAGHPGSRPSGETHYRLRMQSDRFLGKNQVECHRMVYSALQNEFKTGLHALEMELTSPSSENV
ncbi:BolA family transcriptional regulator [Leptospira sp. 96542]|nr:BolA family transcriptional regulator [Leptospira sp. 96542]